MQEQHVTRLEDVVAWLKDSAIPFENTWAGGEYRDLLPLAKIVDSARIVACGEAARGTHEFLTLKHRLFEFLVREKGFTHFALEDGWAEAMVLNNFVLTGQGDPVSMLEDLRFQTNKTQELLEIIYWMSSYNQGRGTLPALEFVGLDMQSCDLAMENVWAYVQTVNPEATDEVVELYGPFWEYADNLSFYADEPLDVKHICRSQVRRMYELLRDRRHQYEQFSSPAEFAFALQNAQIVLQAEEMFSTFDHTLRGRFMAENAAWHLEQAGPAAKMFISTHNGHAAAPLNIDGPMSLGTSLSQRYQEQFLSIGLLFSQGTFNAFNAWQPEELVEHTVGSPPADSYEYALEAVGLPQLFVELFEETSASTWLFQPHRYREIGGYFAAQDAPKYWSSGILPYKFDVLFYLRDITASRLLHFKDVAPQGLRPARSPIRMQPSNVDFKAGLAYWRWGGNPSELHTCGVEGPLARDGEVCAYLKSTDLNPAFLGELNQMILANVYSGCRIRFSAQVKAREVRGHAGLCLRVDGCTDVLAFDNMHNRTITGTQDWQRYEIVLDVPVGSAQIIFGLYLNGAGQVWLDAVRLEIVDSAIPITSTQIADTP